IAENADAVAQYKAGKTQIFGFFMGQVQRRLGKKVDMQVVKNAIERKLQ
ncbi:Asp-tRNA(Asn)/Glu-tRNA(Gln) amidotransferase GatCAB subunit B, partial [Patescibacteria group bacterium]|nr:Asp-tRNA(Asn)/Glu-tRNA(Gln) amidotransferase GatCAB subunit B [Patescibacteria group bacterium]